MNRREMLMLSFPATVGWSAEGQTLPSLQRALQQAGLPCYLLGGGVLVTPFGGRVIGLFPTPDRNAFWTNPVLMKPGALKSEMAKPGWLNPGGDRTWISPEVDVFISDPRHIFESYNVPPSLDPGSYQVSRPGPDSITLAASIEITFLRSKRRVKLQIHKTIRLLREPSFRLRNLKNAAGYELRTVIEAPDLPAGVHPGTWNLLQVPSGGTIGIPLRPGAAPRSFFGKPNFTIRGEVLHSVVRNSVPSKLGVHARDSRGILLYSGGTPARPYTIVRRFKVGAPEDYADVPVDDFSARGYMTQIYVDDGKLGGFGEIEYHAPALDAARGRKRMEDICETWAFEGELPDPSVLY